MEPASGHGWAELQDHGSLGSEIRLINGDDILFTDRTSLKDFFNSPLKQHKREQAAAEQHDPCGRQHQEATREKVAIAHGLLSIVPGAAAAAMPHLSSQ